MTVLIIMVKSLALLEFRGKKYFSMKIKVSVKNEAFIYSFLLFTFFCPPFIINQLYFPSNYSITSPASDTLSDSVSGTGIICFTVKYEEFQSWVVN